MKVCAGCGVSKPLDAFHKWNRSLDGYRARCKECRKPESAAYSHANRERIAAYHAQWAAGNRERERKRKQAWIERNRERVRACHRRNAPKHIESKRRYLNEWRKLNPARYRSQKHRRRALEATGTITDIQWQAALARFGHKCLACGRNDIDMCIDHVIPLSRGGTNDITNTQPLCRSCNSSKHARHVDYRTPNDIEWLRAQ